MLTRRLVVLTLCLMLCAPPACTVLPSGNSTPTPAKRNRRTQTAAASTVTLASPIAPLATTTASALAAPTAVPLATAPQAAGADFCADEHVTTLISSFKTGLQTSNGTLLASLISPTHGMDARRFRNGRVVNYDQEHARFLFESTFAVDWGLAPGSGLQTSGSFHEIILPALLDLLAKNYALTCNQVQVGGTTYQASWPYSGIDFYSVYWPGTQANGSLDWQTWLLGMHYVDGKPYLYAILPFQWEP
jgi:hypothetical protein